MSNRSVSAERNTCRLPARMASKPASRRPKSATRQRHEADQATTLVRVLSLSRDPGLRSLRKLVLERAGFAVIAPDDPKQWSATIAEQEFDVMLLGHSLMPEELDAAMKDCRKQSPRVPIVLSIAGGRRICNERPDVYVEAIDGPEALAAAIRGALS